MAESELVENLILIYKRMMMVYYKQMKILKESYILKCKFVEHILLPDESWNHYTGLPTIDVFKGIVIFLNPGETSETVILYNNQQVKGDSQRGRPCMLSPLESFLTTTMQFAGICDWPSSFRCREVETIVVFWRWFHILSACRCNLS